MLPIVQGQAVVVDATRPSPKGGRHLEQRHAVASRRGLDRGRQPGPAAADDGQLAQRRQGDALVQDLEAAGLDLPQQSAVDVGHHQPGLLRLSVALGQQGDRLVVAPMRPVGLETHQRLEAVAVGIGRPGT